MSIINFTRKRLLGQRTQAVTEGFLCIELLQGLLLLGVLLLLVSAYVVLSVHWQQQAIKRFEALNLLESHLAGYTVGELDQKNIVLSAASGSIELPELSKLAGMPITVEQRQITARWYDERATPHSITMVTL